MKQTRREFVAAVSMLGAAELIGCRRTTMSEATTHAIPQLTDLGNVVPAGYSYYEKVIAPAEGLQVPGAYLKWYDIYPADRPITEEQRAMTREFIASEAKEGRPALKSELGFVMLHRAGKYLLLMIITWRNTNELWESIYHREVDGKSWWAQEFDSSHRGTYCVWELGAVWHERNAWVRFIGSKRDEEAKRAYLADQFSGRV
jgi:hypothetical protein